MYPTPQRFYNAFLKYDTPRPVIDVLGKAFRFGVYCLYRIYGPILQGWRPRDIDSVKFPMSTSPGWPANMFCSSKETALKWYGHMIDKRKELSSQGVRPFCVWQVFGKTELLKTKKLVENDMRLIINPPFDLLVELVTIFEDPFERIQSTYRNHPIKVGFSKYNSGLHELLVPHEAFDEHRVRDARKYDSEYTHEDAKVCTKLMWDTCAPVAKTKYLRNRLTVALIEYSKNFLLFPNNVVQEKDRGTNSGDFRTSQFNSLGGCRRSFTIFYRSVTEELISQGDLIDDFDAAYDHMRRMWLQDRSGDDENESLMDEIAHLYTEERVHKFALEQRLIYKPESVKISRTLEGLSFLGSTFHFHPRYEKWVPVYDGDKAIHSLLHTENSTCKNVDLYRCLALRLEAFWDVPTRMKLTDIRDRLIAYGAKPRPTRRNRLSPEQELAMCSRNDRDIVALYFGYEVGAKIDTIFACAHNVQDTQCESHKLEDHFCKESCQECEECLHENHPFEE